MVTRYNGIPMVYPNAMRMTLLLAAIMAVIGITACSSSSPIPDSAIDAITEQKEQLEELVFTL